MTHTSRSVIFFITVLFHLFITTWFISHDSHRRKIQLQKKKLRFCKNFTGQNFMLNLGNTWYLSCNEYFESRTLTQKILKLRTRTQKILKSQTRTPKILTWLTWPPKILKSQTLNLTLNRHWHSLYKHNNTIWFFNIYFCNFVFDFYCER